MADILIDNLKKKSGEHGALETLASQWDFDAAYFAQIRHGLRCETRHAFRPQVGHPFCSSATGWGTADLHGRCRIFRLRCHWAALSLPPCTRSGPVRTIAYRSAPVPLRTVKAGFGIQLAVTGIAPKAAGGDLRGSP